MSFPNGDQAFPRITQPQPNGEVEWGAPGMSLRAWLAGQWLSGQAASRGDDAPFIVEKTVAENWAKEAVLLADATIAELEKA